MEPPPRRLRRGRGLWARGDLHPSPDHAQAEREAAGDPRPSLEERYGNHAGYVAAVRAAAERLVRQRYLLLGDAERLVQEAEASGVLR